MLHQVSAEEGAVPWRGGWKCQHERKGALCEHTDGCQLLGIIAQEELAECPMPLHQNKHGQACQVILAGKDGADQIYWLDRYHHILRACLLS